MSNDETTPGGGVHDTPPAKRRRALWVATGVAGLTGVVGLAALGGLATREDKSDDANRLSDQHSATAKQNVSDAGRADEERGKESGGQDSGKQDDRSGAEWSGQDDWSGKDRDGRDERDEDGRVREVPCDDDALVEAVVRANNELGGTLKLARDCKYELSDHDRKNGSALPTIRQRITIKGDKSIIKRDSSDAFRIFTVGEGGELTLKGVTVKDGNAAREKKKEQEPWPTTPDTPKTDTPATGEAAPAAAPVAPVAPAMPVVPVVPVAPGGSGEGSPGTYDDGADGGAIL
ncbi:hypothetical protein ACFYZF_28620, partial [Micromonospora sp. NPDC001898]